MYCGFKTHICENRIRSNNFYIAVDYKYVCAQAIIKILS